jgi:hypothetical protein
LSEALVMGHTYEQVRGIHMVNTDRRATATVSSRLTRPTAVLTSGLLAVLAMVASLLSLPSPAQSAGSQPAATQSARGQATTAPALLARAKQRGLRLESTGKRVRGQRDGRYVYVDANYWLASYGEANELWAVRNKYADPVKLTHVRVRGKDRV